MNEERIIRYVTPSAFFLGSLFLAAWSHDPCWLGETAEKEFFHLAAGVGAALFPLGFAITGVSRGVLSLLFARSKNPYESAFSDDSWKRVWELLKFDDPAPQKSKMNRRIAAQTFDHEFLPLRTHAGAVRLWSAFSIAAHSAVAVVLSLPIGRWFFNIGWSARWVWTAVSFVCLLCGIAVFTWRHHRNFLEIQTRRDWSEKKSDAES